MMCPLLAAGANAVPDGEESQRRDDTCQLDGCAWWHETE